MLRRVQLLATLRTRYVSSVLKRVSVPAIQSINRSARQFSSAASNLSNECPVSTNPFTPLPSHINQSADGLFIDSSLPQSFNKILIANRGEIACRVIRSCKLLGIQTVAVYSDADRTAAHVQLADEAYHIGPSPAAQSYLQGQTIIDVAKMSGAQAIHPGYGFLSENAEFARQVSNAGLKWIGPPAEAIVMMGSKSESKHIMSRAGVPVVPGYHGDAQDMDTLKREAQRCGFPLMIKAVMGGGGKGMRIVRNAEELPEAIEACQREAIKSFKDDRVLMERYIERSRHIEFQVFADGHGNAVHLFERDCSVQRRHQKVLEEAPAPGLSAAQRAAMGAQAVNAALAVGYEGAGTVEFIVDADTDEYFFMEMNTRLQVEHPVTEMVVRKDLVQWQLHVASGSALPCKQQDIQAFGHAFEARIYAENPEAGFLPAAGRINELWAPAVTSSIRVESAIRKGDEIGIFYDPMISKLISWGANREEALNRLVAALRAYEITGVDTNVAFLQRCCLNPAFIKGQVDTSFIAENTNALLPPPVEVTDVESITGSSLAAIWLVLDQQRQTAHQSNSPWSDTSSKRFNLDKYQSIKLKQIQFGADYSPVPLASTVEVRALGSEDRYEVKAGGQTVTIQATLSKTDSTQVEVSMLNQATRARVVFDAERGQIDIFMKDGRRFKYQLPRSDFGGLAAGAGASSCFSPMAGRVVKVSCRSGDVVKAGDTLVIMEAMKMEHVIKAPRDGVVDSVAATEGQFIQGQKVLVMFKETEAKSEQ